MGAIHAFRHALKVATNLGSVYITVGCLAGLAAALRGVDNIQAARLFTVSDDLRGRAGVPRSPAETALFQPHINALRRQLSDQKQFGVAQEAPTLEDVVNSEMQSIIERSRNVSYVVGMRHIFVAARFLQSANTPRT
jgi:hypothetical protein